MELVIYAFKNGKQGDIFVQKAPSCTLNDLAVALKKIFNSKNSIDIIGTRHGEKLYETLISREEMSRAEDLKNYFRIPSDNRDLNYAKFFSVGKKKTSTMDDYTSHNTDRLDVEEVKKILTKLNFVKEALNG